MNPSKLQLKLFVERNGPHPESEAFIPVFHRWIKDHALAELVIDVANYAHVPKGPGVVLIGHTGDYYMEDAEGRFGLLYSRKRGLADATFEARLEDLFRRTLHAAALLEKEALTTAAGETRVRFDANELLFRINDRLAAPANDETFAAVRPALEGVARRLFDGPCELTRVGDARSLFSVKVVGTGKAVELPALLARLGGPPVPDLP
ncbi:MAG TPA: hypothetical protein VH328_04020 [Burkholderiaceae bacterium]|jgi:hypothetical protein|nr:hypothetical protein [Burkholderiaceae bacterium]